MKRFTPADLARVAEEAAATPGRLEVLESQWQQDVAQFAPEVQPDPPPPQDFYEAAVEAFRNSDARYREAHLADPDTYAAFQEWVHTLRFSNLRGNQ
jgi:hypothetical protein